jgi:Ca-activated chloride channel family protein
MNTVFVYPLVLYIGIPLTLVMGLVGWYRGLRRAQLWYPFMRVAAYACEAPLPTRTPLGFMVHHVLWTIGVLCLVLATARPRSPDMTSQKEVEGVSILLALDVSQSMVCFDDPQTQIARFTLAKEEAISFIHKRPSDLFGLVIFGEIAATRCPLTYDHRMLIEILKDTVVGTVPSQGTALARSLVMGVQRLMASQAKSKLIVLLTDGEPSEDDRPLLKDALLLAKKADVKVYTIGIGSPEGGFVNHPYGGIVRVPNRLQMDFLRDIAAYTGGVFFEASNRTQLSQIYQTIDRLEKTPQEQPLYTRWYEWYTLCVVGAVSAVCLSIGWGIWSLIL